jgi:uncharacterized protein YjiK
VFALWRIGIAVVGLAVLLAACATISDDHSATSVQEQKKNGADTNSESVVPQGPQSKRKSFTIEAEDFWRLELPQGRRLDASGLTWDGGRLLVVNDEAPELCEVEFGETNVAKLKTTGIFSWNQMLPFVVGKRGRFDFEGLARDEQGRVYVCEEANRWIFRWDPATKKVEWLEIDWAPVRQYFSSDGNASFEGVAVGGGKLWLANERDRARVIEVDLNTLKVVGDFAPQPSSWGLVLHYSDICWFNGKLFLLLRHHRVVLEIDPGTREVLAEYDFHAMEDAPEHEYHKMYPTGTMEGLAVDDRYFWLVTDNNGFARVKDGSERRPTLFKCKRPEN